LIRVATEAKAFVADRGSGSLGLRKVCAAELVVALKLQLPSPLRLARRHQWLLQINAISDGTRHILPCKGAGFQGYLPLIRRHFRGRQRQRCHEGTLTPRTCDPGRCV
jgi:hypothetical protein